MSLKMSFRLVMLNRIPRFFPQRHYATSLAEYESLYEILECDPTSSKTEIRESWLRLSMMHHPDLNQDSPEANEKFLKIKACCKSIFLLEGMLHATCFKCLGKTLTLHKIY